MLYLLLVLATARLNLTSFRQEMFWDEPPEGLFEVDVGLEALSNQHLMVFADLNSDRYTDIVTLEAEQTLSFYLFNTKSFTFDLWTTLTPSNCLKITNVVVGRSRTSQRLFITCSEQASQHTILQCYDLAAN